MTRAVMGLLFVISFCASVKAADTPAPYQRRWVYCSYNMQVDKSCDALIEVMDRAKASGYNGIMLADYKFHVLHMVIPQYFKNAERVRKAAEERGLDLIPAIFPIGYSNGLLAHDANLAEGMPVKDQPFVVKGKEAVLAGEPPMIKNGGFEEAKGDKMIGFGFQDDIGKTTFADTTVFKTGKQSLRMENVAEHNKNQLCRVTQQLNLRPWTCYRMSIWVKTKDYVAGRAFRLTAIGAGEKGRSLTFYEAGLKTNDEWKELEVVFNSLEFSQVNVYAGQWGGKKTGTLWLDDFKIEEMSLVNLLRRDGCPLTITSEDGKTTYEEGKDFDPVVDSKLGQDPYAGHYKFAHIGAAIRIKDGSRITDGQKLKVSWYHPVNIHDGQMMCCLSEPKVYALMKEEATKVNALLKPKMFFMSHDEIRCANWCKACTDRKMTPGQLIADNAKRSVEILKEINPDAKILVWNDMFDPHHNAVEGPFYLVNGPITGSWEGLPKDVIIANWNGGNAAKSLKFFADRGHEQLAAGYYDVDDLSGFDNWQKAREGIPNVTGFMYTTWEQKYKLLEAYGKAAKGEK